MKKCNEGMYLSQKPVQVIIKDFKIRYLLWLLLFHTRPFQYLSQQQISFELIEI